jgi:anti-sigma factor RsiW
VDCPRAEELLSDEIEGSLEEPLLGELRVHLEGCPGCSRLWRAVAGLRETLATTSVPAPPESLEERVGAALRRPRRRSPLAFGIPRSVQALAAVLTVGMTLGVSLAAGALPRSQQVAHHYWDRGAQAEAWVLERGDRWMEDLRLVRSVINMAFEGRLDRMSERLDDYRKALERQQEQSKKGTKADPKGISELTAGSARKNL